MNDDKLALSDQLILGIISEMTTAQFPQQQRQQLTIPISHHR